VVKSGDLPTARHDAGSPGAGRRPAGAVRGRARLAVGPVVPENSASVYEICGPDQWADLVGRYPLDVTRSRRDDWRRATGWAGHWLIPDYAAVAADWDAVHVSVAGYLTTAGIAIPADDGACTMLAGRDPDATWWLTDVLSSTSQPEDWRTDDQAPFGWTQAH
jgi:hypothetical protein